jgi:hypothetical protein
MYNLIIIFIFLFFPMSMNGQKINDIYLLSDYKESHFHYKRLIVDDLIDKTFINPLEKYTFSFGIGMKLTKRTYAELFHYNEMYWVAYSLKRPYISEVELVIDIIDHVGARINYDVLQKSIGKTSLNLNVGTGYIYGRGLYWHGYLDGLFESISIELKSKINGKKRQDFGKILIFGKIV